MRSSGTSRWMLICLVGVAVALTGCPEDEPPQVIGDNECGGEEPLEHDGEDAEPGDACGECGQLVCDGENALTCDDPGANDCGGCVELEANEGDECADDFGNTGVWTCDGEDALTCEVGELNECGGTAPLEASPGDSCGACQLDEYRCDGINAVECPEQIGCPQPRDVSATQGEHGDRVVVTWRGSVYADGYKIYRDDEEIAEVSGGSLSFSDEDAASAGPPTDIDVTASDDQTDGVHLQWEHGDGSIAEHDYAVEILFPEASSERSPAATGWRSVDVDEYIVSVDGGDRTLTTDETGIIDEDVAKATVESESVKPWIDEEETGWDSVTLEAEPEIVDAPEHDYEVTLVTTQQEANTEPGEATGQRAHGDAEYVWEASFDDGGEDDFTALDCDGPVCTDEFPADSPATEKYYTLTVDGDGIEEITSESVVGAVELLEVAPAEIDDVMVGETATISAQIVDPNTADPVQREGVQLEIEVSDEDAVDGDLPGPVSTGTDGSASDTVSFWRESAGGVTVDWSATGDSRVSEETFAQHFDVKALADGEGHATLTIGESAHDEMLADGIDAFDVEATVLTDDGGDAVSGARVEFAVKDADGDDADGGTQLDCEDDYTDAGGTVSCLFSATEPGEYTIELEEPVAAGSESAVPFFAAHTEHYADISGQINDVALLDEFLVVAGENLEAGERDEDNLFLVDRVTGEVVLGSQDAADEEENEVMPPVDAVEVSDDALLVLSQIALVYFDSGDLEVEEPEDMVLLDFGDMMTVEDDHVIVVDSEDGSAISFEITDEGLEETGKVEDLSNEFTGDFESAEVAAIRSGNGHVFGLGNFEYDPGEDQYFITYSLPELEEVETYLDRSDVTDGEIAFFDVDDEANHYVAGDFEEIAGQQVAGLAKVSFGENGVEVDETFDVADDDVTDVAGGLWFYDSLLWSAGTFDAEATNGPVYNADDSDTDYGAIEFNLGQQHAWAELAAMPRLLMLFDRVDENGDATFEVVPRLDVE